MRLGELTSDTALAVLAGVTAPARHRFWPDGHGYADISWRGVLGHRQVTDAYLAGLARHQGGRLVSFEPVWWRYTPMSRWGWNSSGQNKGRTIICPFR